MKNQWILAGCRPPELAYYIILSSNMRSFFVKTIRYWPEAGLGSGVKGQEARAHAFHMDGEVKNMLRAAAVHNPCIILRIIWPTLGPWWTCNHYRSQLRFTDNIPAPSGPSRMRGSWPLILLLSTELAHKHHSQKHNFQKILCTDYARAGKHYAQTLCTTLCTALN